MKLSHDQVEYIQQKIRECGITRPTLRDDVLDHLCCELEGELEHGKPFVSALDAAIKDLSPGGLRRLEEQTSYLLNSKKINTMKKLMYLSGFIGALCITVGTTFKFLHMPGADELLLIGYPLLFFLFIPVAAVNQLRFNLTASLAERGRIALGALSAITAGLASIFKILHLQGFDFLLFSAVLLFSVGFLPLLFFTMYRKSVTEARSL